MASQHTKPTSGPSGLTALVFTTLLTFSSVGLAAERFETPVGLSVNPAGAANFTIPIEAPPGTAGMAPSLSLNYSSQGNNGMLGMGWTLSGLSAIYRCGRTLIQDGVLDTINYNANDKYCMDGQRLVPVTATASPPAGCTTSTEYRTERESFTRVVSCGTAGSGPAYFVVSTKAGQIIEFGNTTDSRIEAQGKTDVRAWAVNKISDTIGNYLTISYTEDNTNGDYRPSRIDYTGNTAAGLVPYNSVRFVYQTRSDITPRYQAGSVMKTMKLLANVQTYAKVGATDTLIKDYRLSYQPDTPNLLYSRLTNIQECATDGSCLNPTGTNFGWPPVIADLSIPDPSSPAIPTSVGGYAAWHTQAQYMQIGDFNGDGKMDYMWIPDGQNFWDVAYSTGNGFSIVDHVIPSSVGGYYPSGSQQQYMQVGDFNGDGKMDYMWIPYGQTFWDIAYSTGSGFTIIDHVISSSVGGFYPSHSQPQYMKFGDFNGDGKMDYMWIPDGQTFWDIAYSTGSGFTIVDHAIPTS
ncbi:MAG: SpvB/TcaC N-terminal domain-containing protein, partial [Gallionellaceae bacterium]|nr:SpvB/TcaC N-terminal domain-containing protein [Gallionellaceae bacterium]